MVKVSVIIPTYNREKFVGRAIESVLNQTYKDYEIIVVDDGSMDNTKSVLAQFDNKIQYVYQENHGISGARNRGIQESKGEYIAFLDSDDVWIPEKLTIQVDILNKNRNVGLVYSKLAILDEKGKKCGMKPEENTGRNFLELIKIGGDIPTSAVMVRRECFDKVGLFDNTLPPMEDFDMWLRISRFYDIYEITGRILANYYWHDGQITSNKIKVYDGTVRLQKKIYRNYKDLPNVPVELLIRRIVENQYMLSKSYNDEKFYWKSLRPALAAIFRFPHLGILFFKDNDHVFVKLFKLIKPYGLLVVSFMKACWFSFVNFLKFAKPNKGYS